MKKILFITNCGKKKFLGYGHIFRCINIANFFSNKLKIFFLCENKNTFEILKDYNFNLVNKCESKNYFFDYIFCDLPNSNNIDFNQFKNSKKIIIDEFNNFKKRIKGKILKSKNIRKFLFLKFSNILKVKINKKKIKKIDFLISFGGSDYYNHSPRILRILNKNENKKFKFKFLKKLTGKNNIPASKLINNYNDVFSLYFPKYFIGSGGNTMFEMLSNNIACLLIPTNKIEKKYIDYLRINYCVDFFKPKINLSAQLNIINQKKNLKVNILKTKRDYQTLLK